MGEAVFDDEEHGAADLLCRTDLRGKDPLHEREDWFYGRVEDSVRRCF